jgi:hypothetical protein
MADLASRLRGPRTTGPTVDPGPSRGRSSGIGASGDLFEHFGVPERDPALLAAIVAAEPCPRCGWLRSLAALDPCRLCDATMAPAEDAP